MSDSSAVGTVESKDGSTTLSTCSAVTVSSGTASCSGFTLTAGVHSQLTATFTGSGAYAGITSTDTTSITVNAVSTTTGLGLSPLSGDATTSFTLTATLTPSGATGTVLFQDGSSTLSGCSAIAVSSGTAVCSGVQLTVGSHSLSAVFSGNGVTYGSATSTGVASITINPAVTVTAAPTSGSPTTTFTITATFSPSSSTGSVNFQSDGTSLSGCTSSPIVSGVATCTGFTLAVGSHSLTAVYTGSGSYTGASFTASAAAPVIINAVVPALTIVNQPLIGNVPTTLQVVSTVAPGASTVVHLSCTSPVTNTIVASIDFTIASGSLNSELELWTPPKATDYQLNCSLTVTSSADTIFSSLSPTTVTELVTQLHALPATVYIYGKTV